MAMGPERLLEGAGAPVQQLVRHHTAGRLISSHLWRGGDVTAPEPMKVIRGRKVARDESTEKAAHNKLEKEKKAVEDVAGDTGLFPDRKLVMTQLDGLAQVLGIFGEVKSRSKHPENLQTHSETTVNVSLQRASIYGVPDLCVAVIIIRNEQLVTVYTHGDLWHLSRVRGDL